MASTRDINSKGNYYLEQKQNSQLINNLTYYNGSSGHANKTAFPELYLQGHMPPDNFSHNFVDIESALLGIDSTNLVKEREIVDPDFKSIPTVSFFDRQPVITKEHVKELKGQRPFIM